jgi:hypothetical protein
MARCAAATAPITWASVCKLGNSLATVNKRKPLAASAAFSRRARSAHVSGARPVGQHLAPRGSQACFGVPRPVGCAPMLAGVESRTFSPRLTIRCPGAVNRVPRSRGAVLQPRADRQDHGPRLGGQAYWRPWFPDNARRRPY